MKNINSSQTLKLEDFKIVEFQNSLDGIRGGTGWLCRYKPPTSGPNPDDDTVPDPEEDAAA